MKKFILTLSLCVALSALAIAAPAIYVVQPVYNFGSVSDGFAVIHYFVLENRGNEALTIFGVKRDCGCTTTELGTPHTIEPGSSVELEVRVNTTSFGGRIISKVITVSSNDPETPFLSLQITGQVIAISALKISVADARYDHYALIDLRSAEEYQAHHLFGAINVTAEELVEVISNLPHDAIIILYDAAFQVSEAAALTLRNEGFDFTFALVGGLNEWIHQYGMKFLTNPDTDYDLPPQISYPHEAGIGTLYELSSDLNSRFCLFVDVRSADEYAASHIMGAINIPFEELESWIDTLPKTALLISYDQAGFLNDLASQWMINNGFAIARSMVGGLDEWIQQYQQSYLFSNLPAQINDEAPGK